MIERKGKIMNEEIRFQDFKLALISLWRKKVLIIAITILAFLIGILVTLTADSRNIYRAQSSVYGAIYGSYEESSDATRAMLNYADVLTSRKVCERAESIIGDSNITASDIQKMISSQYSADSILLDIYAYSNQPEVAISVANAVAQAFVIEMQNLLGSDAVQMLDSADNYQLHENGLRNLWLKRMIFGLVGLVASCAVFFVLELFSDKLKSVEQCVADEDDVVLAILPEETE